MVSQAKTPRRRKDPQYTRFRYSKRIKHPHKIPNTWKIFRTSLEPLYKNWKLFGGIMLVYIILSLVLVRGFASTTNVAEMKALLDSVFEGAGGQVTSSATIFGMLLGSGGGATEAAGIYQSVLLVVMSLAFIWALRSVQGEKAKKLRLRDSFYKGMYPLVPFLLVSFVIGLQLIPFAVGATLYGIVVGNGLAITVVEQIVWLAGFVILCIISLYLIAPSIMALFVVTLPNMDPLKALRSAKKLTKHRRWTVLRKEVALPFFILILMAAIMLPFIVWFAAIAEWVYFVVSLLILPVILSYLYALYRELL